MRLTDCSAGVVHRARWIETLVAVKLLMPPERDPLESEAGRVTALDQVGPRAAEGGASLRLRLCTCYGRRRATAPAGLIPLPGRKQAQEQALVHSLQKEASIMSGLRHPNCVLYLGMSIAAVVVLLLRVDQQPILGSCGSGLWTPPL